MAGKPITQFKLSSSRLAPLRDCMRDYGVGANPEAEWPNNLLSRKTVVYESGVIAREGDPVRHHVDPEELELCRKLARTAHRVAKEIEFGLDTEAEFSFAPFFITANSDEPVPHRIDEALIRSRFGGTIFPPATISVEPLSEDAAWWAGLSRGLADEGEEEDLERWRALIRWFQARPEFTDRAFVQIGDYNGLKRLKESDFPPGTEMAGSTLPRLVIGLTQNGSLAGVFGSVVQT